MGGGKKKIQLKISPQIWDGALIFYLSNFFSMILINIIVSHFHICSYLLFHSSRHSN
jgi:hypothetical protein